VITEHLAAADASAADINLDVSGTSWEFFLQDIVKRSATLVCISIAVAFTSSRMRPDGCGGMTVYRETAASRISANGRTPAIKSMNFSRQLMFKVSDDGPHVTRRYTRGAVVRTPEHERRSRDVRDESALLLTAERLRHCNEATLRDSSGLMHCTEPRRNQCYYV
jgi:hypothetical protein